MKITVVTPASGGSLSGNRTTAHRWERLLGELGHEVAVAEEWDGGETEVLVALHGRKSFPSIERFRDSRPDGPLVVVMTGTDLYRDIDQHLEVMAALEFADRVVVLQPLAIDRLPVEARPKARVIYQSATPPPQRPAQLDDAFRVCLLAHLRPIKDPLLGAAAVRLLPSDSRVQLTHAGAPLDADLADRARAESELNPRYEWVGAIDADRAKQLLADSDVLLLSSHDEGGANVVSEAIVAGVPPLSTDIPGSVGLLGEDYPGLYPVGDARRLADLLSKAERNAGFRSLLHNHSESRRALFAPEVERAAWRDLLGELLP